MENSAYAVYLAICHPSCCTVVSGIVVGVCNRSQMTTSKCTCLIFGVSIGLAMLFAIRGQVVVGQSHPVVQSHPGGAQLPVNVATTADLEHLKRELTTIMRSEIAAAKHDILDGISTALSLFLSFLCLFAY